MRRVPQGDAQHLFCRGHLQVERQRQLRFETRDVGIRDVAAVFPQMRRDAVRPGARGLVRGPDGIWMTAAPRITNGRHVIDVDTEPQGAAAQCSRRCRFSRYAHENTRSTLLTTDLAFKPAMI